MCTFKMKMKKKWVFVKRSEERISLPLTCKKGMMPSRAMACNSRGAPVRLCSPAPQQEKNEPITITHGDGQARILMTGFVFTEKPNLKNTYALLNSNCNDKNAF